MNRWLFDKLDRPLPASGFALEAGSTRLNVSELRTRAESLAFGLEKLGAQRVAIYMDNGIDWIVADLACQAAGLIVVPLPLFFSPQQVRHALASSSIDTVITDQDLEAVVPGAQPVAAASPLPAAVDGIYRLASTGLVALPAGTQKITFTSGTTGTPKGVCLSAGQQLALAAALVSATGLEAPKHLCVLPLSTLLENLAGVYAPLMSGGTVIVPQLAEVGLAGSSGLDVKRWLASIEYHQPNSLILVPEMLRALTLAVASGWQAPSSLQFVAVGGGKVAPELLRLARQGGIPAYEGYGLSECASVVCLNVPGSDRPGSVGRPLQHVTVTTRNKEIVVRGNTFLGYVDQPETWHQQEMRTGDLGYVDADGFCHVNGRLKHQLISSYGRNISPEWVESELLAGPVFRQAVVLGDDRPYCVALVFAGDPTSSDEDIAAFIHTTNQRLPDYARIADWYRLPCPLSQRDNLLTANGRPKRRNIEQAYKAVIEDMYDTVQEQAVS